MPSRARPRLRPPPVGTVAAGLIGAVLTIDGSFGEGGGQVLRTSLALSAITGTPFTVHHLRAKRSKPGLLRQHLTGVRAVAEVCGAEVRGAALGSTELTFAPGEIRPGEYSFSIGTAGSCGLVLQAVLPVLVSAAGPSRVVITGGTHNGAAPPAPFLQHALLPLVRRMGPTVRLTVDRCGFYPAGGGQYTVEVAPAPLVPLVLEQRGELREIVPVAVVSNLPTRIGERELGVVRKELGLPGSAGRVEVVDSPGPGNAVWLEAHAEHVTDVFTGFGRKGAPAEQVAQEAVDELVAWRERDVPVGEHLADQLLVFLALAGGGRFRTVPPSLHTTTNAAIVSRFLDRSFRFEDEPDGAVAITVEAR
jgi:RNA 3'-terminal phosphate cyclase (ATP)